VGIRAPREPLPPNYPSGAVSTHKTISGAPFIREAHGILAARNRNLFSRAINNRREAAYRAYGPRNWLRLSCVSSAQRSDPVRHPSQKRTFRTKTTSMEQPYGSRPLPQVVFLFSGFAGLLFISTFLLLGSIATPYNPVRDTISALEFTSLGLAQRLNFALFGLLLIAFAFALRIELRHSRGARLIPLFQFLSGLAVIGDGLFIHEPLHMVCDLVAFNSALLVPLLFAWRSWPNLRWRAWAYYSIAAALLMMSFLTAFGLANHSGGPAGVMEKLATVTRTLWSTLLTIKLLRGARL
jgi:hypothetical protein